MIDRIADDLSHSYQDGFNDGVASVVPCEWKKEMPTESGWYWAVTDLNGLLPEIFPCYYDAQNFEMQSIERGIACEILGVISVMPMQFPLLPKEET